MPNIRLLFILILFSFIVACSTEKEADSQSNVIKDKIVRDQFNVLHKTQQVEQVLSDSVRNRQDLIDQQSSR